MLLAAGQARRMRGRDKLLEPVDGTPLLRHVAEQALRSGYEGVVTLPPASARAEVIAGLNMRQVEVSGDMSASLATGLRALAPGTKCAAILLADMPDISSDMIQSVVQRCLQTDRPARAASEDGRAGHPVALPARLFERASMLNGDHGMRDVLAQEPVELCPTPGIAALTDLDTPEDWAKWRAQRKAPS